MIASVWPTRIELSITEMLKVMSEGFGERCAEGVLSKVQFYVISLKCLLDIQVEISSLKFPGERWAEANQKSCQPPSLDEIDQNLVSQFPSRCFLAICLKSGLVNCWIWSLGKKRIKDDSEI